MKTVSQLHTNYITKIASLMAYFFRTTFYNFMTYSTYNPNSEGPFEPEKINRWISALFRFRVKGESSAFNSEDNFGAKSFNIAPWTKTLHNWLLNAEYFLYNVFFDSKYWKGLSNELQMLCAVNCKKINICIANQQCNRHLHFTGHHYSFQGFFQTFPYL